MRYLVDTDWAIDYMNGVGRIVRRLDGLRPAGLGISIVTFADLYEGVAYGRNSREGDQELREFLLGFEIVEIDLEICRIFALERGRLRAAGMLIKDFDLLIGATALRHNLTLLTNNGNHFGRISGLRIVSG